MHKLTSLEAQRVTSVLEDTLERLQALSYVPVMTNNSQDELLSQVDPSQAKCLQTLWQLEENHRRSRDSAFSNNAYGDLSGYEVTSQLHQATRSLCRLLRKNPAGLSVLMESGSPRPAPVLSFSQYLQDLAAITFRRLSTTVEEEATNATTLTELTEKEKAAEKERESLAASLEFQRAEKEREVASLGQQISKLRAELHDITRSNELEVANIEQTAKENVEAAREAHEEKVRTLEVETARLTERIKTLAVEHRDAELALRKKKSKSELELALLIAKYDKDMSEKQAMIEDLRAKFKAEREELAVLQKHFDKVDANDRIHKEELRLLAIVEDCEREANIMLDDAAITIQKRARGIKDRKEVAALKKKKAGKGGKGGKKGKK